jgi:hypothetical protein
MGFPGVVRILIVVLGTVMYLVVGPSNIRSRTLSMAAIGCPADIRAGVPADACVTIPIASVQCGNRIER